MHQCPHCSRDGITSLQKAMSVYFAPAECSYCHGRSHVHVVYGAIAISVWIVLTWLFIGLSYMSRTSFFLLGSVPAGFLAINKYLLEAPLRALPPTH